MRSGLNAKASRQRKFTFEGGNRGPNSDNPISTVYHRRPTGALAGRTPLASRPMPLPASSLTIIPSNPGPLSSRRPSIVPGADGYDDLMIHGAPDHSGVSLPRNLPSLLVTARPANHHPTPAAPFDPVPRQFSRNGISLRFAPARRHGPLAPSLRRSRRSVGQCSRIPCGVRLATVSPLDHHTLLGSRRAVLPLSI